MLPRLPFEPPVEPMLAKPSDGLPSDDGWLFEPKWDGFRALVFKDGGEIYTQSRDLKPLDRYFPELADPLRAALPDRCVLAIAGDGDFLMNGQELATAAQYGVDLLVIVIDNGAYGTIRMHQEREFPGRVVATDLANPDFAALARAFGGWAARVETTDEFAAALKEAQQLKGVRLLHCVSDIERLNAAGTTVASLREGRRPAI